MGKLIVYNFVTMNGYFKGPKEDISWAKQEMDPEEQQFAASNFDGDNILLFGRVTYDMMASYWPTKQALKDNPEVAKGMNNAEKIVISKSLKKADWENTRIINGNLEEEIKKLKKAGKNITILGSGSIVSQLAEKGLIDEYEIMVHPVVIGEGTPLLHDVHHKLDLKLVKTRAFKSGKVLNYYKPSEN